MNIRDAKPGDVLVDRDGGIWLRGAERARGLYCPTCDGSGDDDTIDADAMDIGVVEKFGPFAVIYPQADAGADQCDALLAEVEKEAALRAELTAEIRRLRAEVARLQAELDAARAIIESGASR